MSEIALNSKLEKISNRTVQWKANFNPGQSKKTKKELFSWKLNKPAYICFVFDYFNVTQSEHTQ